jgi:hypothetical protein
MIDRAAEDGEQRFSNILKAGCPGHILYACTLSFEDIALTQALV